MSISDGIESSTGDPRVLFALNAILSAAFAGIVLTLADLGGAVEFTWMRLLVLTLVIMALTYLVTH
ncbi:hypothetical protein [Halovivax sp.]|uniref:hypothetical protein n=1 Tax=Halovivax sp. TaxID=1935978 RepID=UPI0025C5FECB|nr:hypothetical protein [Halovivax sp.]